MLQLKLYKVNEFIESCCKTILEESGGNIVEDLEYKPQVKASMEITVKAILGNLHGIAGNIAALEKRLWQRTWKNASG